MASYIELNPVRTGMVIHPADYPGSGFRYNAMGIRTTSIQKISVSSDQNIDIITFEDGFQLLDFFHGRRRDSSKWIRITIGGPFMYTQ